MEDSCLIVFVKNAVLGKVKTRLAIDIGHEEALRAYESLCSRLYNQCKQIQISKFVSFSDFIPEHDIWLSHFIPSIQIGNTLGERMQHAIRIHFEKFKNVILIGSDCPYITEEHINQTLSVLQSHDIVFGPTLDGGYYLIAMSKPHEELFANISWSTEMVLDQSIAICTQLGLTYFCLEVLEDVDSIFEWNNFVTYSIKEVKNLNQNI